MPKGVRTEMFKVPAWHTNENPLQSHSNTFSAQASGYRTSLVPYASVPANYKRSNQFHHGLIQGDRLQWHQLHGRCISTWHTYTHSDQPALCGSPLKAKQQKHRLFPSEGFTMTCNQLHRGALMKSWQTQLPQVCYYLMISVLLSALQTWFQFNSIQY